MEQILVASCVGNRVIQAKYMGIILLVKKNDQVYIGGDGLTYYEESGLVSETQRKKVYQYPSRGICIGMVGDVGADMLLRDRYLYTLDKMSKSTRDIVAASCILSQKLINSKINGSKSLMASILVANREKACIIHGSGSNAKFNLTSDPIIAIGYGDQAAMAAARALHPEAEDIRKLIDEVLKIVSDININVGGLNRVFEV